MSPRRSESTWQEVSHIVAAFEALQKAVARSADPQVRAFAEPLLQGLLPGRQAVAAGRDARWPTGLLTGLRQGGREIPHLIEMLPEDERRQAIAQIDAAGGIWVRSLITD